jgi:D-3-phosphoglycerate dehydrogenase
LIAMGITTVRNALAGLDGTLDPALVVNPSVLTDHQTKRSVKGKQ